MKKAGYLGLLILNISKRFTYKFWYDYLKPNHAGKTQLWNIDTDSLIVYIETEIIYADIKKDVKTRFDISNNKLDWPLRKQKNKKVIWLMKHKLGGKNNYIIWHIEIRNIQLFNRW